MKRNSERCMALVLALMMILSLFPAAALAEGDGSLPVHFIGDETTASVTVYDAGGQPVAVGADGVHHLTPGTYSYSATAEGYELVRVTMQPNGDKNEPVYVFAPSEGTESVIMEYEGTTTTTDQGYRKAVDRNLSVGLPQLGEGLEASEALEAEVNGVPVAYYYFSVPMPHASNETTDLRVHNCVAYMPSAVENQSVVV